MAYPEVCFQNLIGIKNTCTPMAAVYWVDDIPGIDLRKLANVAEENAPTGEKLGIKLIEAAARYMAADTEAIYDATYKVQNTLVSGCSNCSFLTTTATGPLRGILIKNNTESAFSKIILDKLIAQVNTTGTFTMVLDDGTTDNRKTIEHAFEAGVEYEFINLNYSTKKKSIKLYFEETGQLLPQLSCPRSSGSGCGCSGASAVVSDLVYTGLVAGLESQNSYAFKPCAVIACDAQDLLCFVAHSAPRMIGMALLYKVAQLYFETRFQTSRNNKIGGTNTTETMEESKRYNQLYLDKLNGNGTRGVKDLVFTTLQQTHDVCVICNSMVATAWAAT